MRGNILQACTSKFALASPSPWPLYICLMLLTTSGVFAIHDFSNANMFLMYASPSVLISMMLLSQNYKFNNLTVIVVLFNYFIIILAYFIISLSLGRQTLYGFTFEWEICILYFSLFINIYICSLFFYIEKEFVLKVIIQVFLLIFFLIITYPYITFRILLYIVLFVCANDIIYDNTLLSSSGNQLPPMGGTGNPQPHTGGGGNPQPHTGGGGNPLPPNNRGPNILLSTNDVEPLHAQHLRTVHSKLSRLLAIKDNLDVNKGKTMNSPNLSPDLVFTDIDRDTMYHQIVDVHPSQFFRFTYVRGKFSYTQPVSIEILNLFKPDTLC